MMFVILHKIIKFLRLLSFRYTYILSLILSYLILNFYVFVFKSLDMSKHLKK